jgi:Crinkler effector protein N-terminal domain
MNRQLTCVVEGNPGIFYIEVPLTGKIYFLHKLILGEGIHNAAYLIPKDLALWKVCFLKPTIKNVANYFLVAQCP